MSQKEPYMVPIHPFILRTTTRMKEYFNIIATDPQCDYASGKTVLYFCIKLYLRNETMARPRNGTC